MRHIKGILVTLLMLAAPFLTAQLSLSQHSSIDTIIERLFSEGKLHGGILIAEGETVIYEKAHGMADRDLGIPNSTNTRFIINSTGKMFTAILTLQLVEEGLIELEDPVSKHLPWFDHERADDITIHHLLAHRSGMKGYFFEQIEGNLEFFIPQREVLDKISEQELKFEPGTAFDYCNTGFLLLGEIIMKYREADYYDVQRQRIFEPLLMKSTYNSTSIYGPGSPVYYLGDGRPTTPFPHSNYRGDGGAKSTLSDLHKFMVAFGSERLLKPESWRLMFTEHSLPEEAISSFGAHNFPYGYGCGLHVLPYSGENTALAVGHGGAGYGSSNFMMKFIEHDRIIIIWNNQFLNPIPMELFEALAELDKGN